MSDYASEMRDVLEKEGREALTSWRKILKGGGKVKAKGKCEYCERPNTFEVEVADAEQQRHIMRFLTEFTQAKPKEAEQSLAARTQGKRVDELSDHELQQIVDEGFDQEEWDEFQAWKSAK